MTSFAEFSYFSLWSYISWCFFNSWQLRVARSFPCIATIVIFLVAKLQLSSLQMFSRSAVSESTGCSGLPFDIVITFFFHSKLHSQLMRGLLCSWTDWDFTVYERAFWFYKPFLSSGRCKNSARTLHWVEDWIMAWLVIMSASVIGWFKVIVLLFTGASGYLCV